MKLYKIALKNIFKSIKDYAIYFFTLILGVSIFYVFNAIDSQTVLLDAAKSTLSVIDLMTSILSGVSVFVAFILGFLIIYASQFLIKRRNKEFAIYILLGMSKRKISFILFFETLLIGVLSFVCGLVLGIGLSQLMSVLVVNMFEANMTKFQFVFSMSACLKTLVYFSIMYLIVMVFNTVTINRCKLIDLLQAGHKTEQIKLKNPWLCTIIFVISVGVLGYAYYLVTGGVNYLDNATDILIPIAMGSISTFFIFWSLSGLLMKLCLAMKKRYYKGINSFVVRQISSKINTMVFSMTTICLMLFITICVLSSALSVKNSMMANINEGVPVDVQYTKRIAYNQFNQRFELSDDESILPAIREDFNLTIEQTLENNGFDLNNLKDLVDYNMYYAGLTMKDTLGEAYSKISIQYPQMTFASPELIMSVSDYNKVASMYHQPTYELASDQYLIVGDYQQILNLRNESLALLTKIKINDYELSPKYNECQKGFVEISQGHVCSGIFLVSDEVASSLQPYYQCMIANYNASSKEEKQAIEDQVIQFQNDNYNQTTWLINNTRIDIIESSIGVGAMVAFIALYLGIIFLISSAALLALKELSESSDNIERYQMLRKIGVDEKAIDLALFKQIGFFFIFPLVLALIHSYYGMKFSSYILSVFGNSQMLSSILMTGIFLVIIYGGYFILTYLCSRSIIKERR